MARPDAKLAYSIPEACAATSLGRSTIYTLIAEGRLQARKIGGRRVVLAESLQGLIAGAGDTKARS